MGTGEKTKSRSLWGRGVLLGVSLAMASPLKGQELELRRWAHLPVETNFLGAAYAYTEADISLDPTLRIEDAQVELQTAALKYIRTFEFLGKSARFDLLQLYQSGRWEGLIDGRKASTVRDGAGDTIVRLAMNLYGAPPLKGQEFAAYRKNKTCETVVGVGLALHLPTGEYLEDRLINLGGNRYIIRPQFGVMHIRGKWSWEMSAAAWIYTDNDDFNGGKLREQDPMITTQANVTYTPRPGLWFSAATGYNFVGQSKVDGRNSNDSIESIGWSLSMGFPVSKSVGMKIGYVGLRTQSDIGVDSDTLSAAVNFRW